MDRKGKQINVAKRLKKKLNFEKWIYEPLPLDVLL